MPTAPASVSPFALGTAEWGAGLRGDALDRLYDAFRAAGGVTFDTAHVYACWKPEGAGCSERAVGEIVRRRGDRAAVRLATKGGHPPMENMYPRPGDYLSPRQIAADVADSLQRLGTDFVELYFLHRDDPRVPVGEVVDALHEHVLAGRLRAVGVSNWTAARIVEANAYARANGSTPLTITQPKLSLAVPKPSSDKTVPPYDAGDLDFYAAAGLTVYAYSPTANGYFATGGTRGAGGWGTATSARRLAAAEAVAIEIGATPNQVALAYLLRLPCAVVPILGTSDVGHLADALAAKDVRLSEKQMKALAVE